MSALPDLYPGFEKRRVAGAGVDIHVRIGGSGPPLLLLHGFPQTHVIWHLLAPELAQHFTLVIADLRGCGESDSPPGDAAHATYSKRVMGEDCAALMAALGYDRFAVAGHDRGARVAYRLALDRPDAVSRLVVLDILPTLEVWERMTADSAIASYHWAFLAQPAPLPETLIGSNPAFYCERKLAAWSQAKDLSAFAPAALTHYRTQMSDPARVHAMCEDYRAGATLDRRYDAEDRTAGRKIGCPALILWGTDYVGKGTVDPLLVWRAWCDTVEGHEVRSGHFLAEENPEAVLAAMLAFLR